MKRLILSLLIFFFIAIPGHTAERVFPLLNGKSISYKALLSPKNAVLFIWATWCPSCRRELGKLAQKSIFFETIDIWYVNTGESISAVEAYAKDRSLSDRLKSKIVMDREGYIAGRFSITTIPTYVFVKDGQIILKSHFLDDNLLERVFGKKR